MKSVSTQLFHTRIQLDGTCFTYYRYNYIYYWYYLIIIYVQYKFLYYHLWRLNEHTIKRTDADVDAVCKQNSFQLSTNCS